MGTILVGVEKKAVGVGCQWTTRAPLFFLYQVYPAVESESSVFRFDHGGLLDH
jgi:hypothetical protein